MNTSNTGSRLSPASLAAAYLHHAYSIGGLLAAGVLYGVRPELWPGRWAWTVIGVLLLIRLVQPIYTWLNLSYETSKSHLRITGGLLVQRTRTMSWSDVAALDTEAPWAYRIFGLRLVSLRAGGQEEIIFTLPGVKEEIALSMAGRVRNHRTAELAGDAQQSERLHGDAIPAAGQEIYHARLSDLVAASLVYGQFIVVGTGAVVGLADVLDRVGVLSQTQDALFAIPVVGVIVVGMAVIAVGCTLTLIRYYGFDVHQTEDHITVQYGLISRRARKVRPSAVMGIRMHRNPIEMAMDRVRLSLLTIDSESQLGRNLALPPLPRATVRAIVSSTFEEHASSEILAFSGRRSIIRSLIVATICVFLTALIFVLLQFMAQLPLILDLACTAATLIAILGIAKLITARFAFKKGMVAWRTHHLTERESIVSPQSVHLIHSVHLIRRNPLLVRIHYFAGMPRILTAFCSSARTIDQIAVAMEDACIPLAARRRKKEHIVR